MAGPDGKRGDSLRQQRKRVISVERALWLLKAFDLPGEQLSLAALAQRSALHKSTILRLAGTLVHMGFLNRTDEGRFLLGPELYRLGLLTLSEKPKALETLVRPALHRLVECLGETASFYVMDGGQRICLFRENSTHPRRRYLKEGARSRLDNSASAQIFKTFILESETPNAREIRKAGCVVCVTRDKDLTTIAVPVRDGRDRVFAAIGVSGSVDRFTPAKIDSARRSLMQEAALIRHAALS